MAVFGIDVSSHQTHEVDELVTVNGAAHVVVKLYLNVGGEARYRPHAKAQIASALECGCSIGGYVWCYQSVDPVQTVMDAHSLAAEAGVTLPILWLDCEDYTVDGRVADPGPNTEWLRKAVATCREMGLRVGIYTAAWWWIARIGRQSEFSELPLWGAQYDLVPTLESLRLFGGWTFASGKQYTSRPIDQNVFLDSVTKVEDGMTEQQRKRILDIAGKLRTVSIRSQLAADAVARVGEGAAWQYRDVLAERDAEEFAAWAKQLEEVLG